MSEVPTGKVWGVMLVGMAVMLAIPLAAILLAGAASGFPIIEPLRPWAWPALRFVLVLGILVGGIILMIRVLGPERVAGLCRGFFEWRWSSVVVQAGLFSMIMGLMAAAMGPLILFEKLWLMFLMLGFGLMSAAVRRVGEERFCAKCGYAQVGESIAAREQEDRCPECGALWRKAGGATKGRRVISPGPIVAGALMVVLGFGWLPAMLFFPKLEAARHAIIPTGMLISGVVDARSSAPSGAMEMLAQRELSRNQELRLMTGLLDKRVRRRGLFREERAWLESALNRLPPELVERFFADELEVMIDGPERARAGEEVSLGLHVQHRGMNFGTVHDMHVAFGGFVVDDELHELHEQRDEPIAANRLGRVRIGFSHERAPHLPAANPELVLRPEEPGVIHVRAVLWLYAVPYQNPATFSWSEDGTPSLPQNTLWKKRLELEHTIEVVR